MQRHRRAPRPAAFALCQPGTGAILRRAARHQGMDVTTIGHDGRADVVGVGPRRWEDLVGLRGAEIVCADLGKVRLLPSLRATTAQVDAARLSAALSSLGRLRLLSGAGHVRLVVRLQNERYFSRSALREATARHLGLPVTRGHQAAHELWLVQDAKDSLRFGLRVPGLEATRRPRIAERPGSLRASMAAAMVSLVGDASGRLLDPCCGSGSILAEASLAGWPVTGGDLATDAIAAATANGSGDVLRLDARRLPFRDDAFEVVISNLPFGHQYEVQGAPVAWYRKTLAEATRVAPRAIVLAPASKPFRQALGRLRVTLRERHDVALLGRPSAIWVLER